MAKVLKITPLQRWQRARADYRAAVVMAEEHKGDDPELVEQNLAMLRQRVVDAAIDLTDDVCYEDWRGSSAQWKFGDWD